MRRPQFPSTSAWLALVSPTAVEGALYGLAVPEMSSARRPIVSGPGVQSIADADQLIYRYETNQVDDLPEVSVAYSGSECGIPESGEAGLCSSWELPE